MDVRKVSSVATRLRICQGSGVCQLVLKQLEKINIRT
jgi:hypothetical protein